MTALRPLLPILLLTWVPGALIFRLPIGVRAHRSSLSIEERAFWQVLLGLLLSSIVGLSLAAAGSYTLDRLLWINAAISLAILAFGGRRLLLESPARARWTLILPLCLVLLGVRLYSLVPPSEYVMGGRDPGVYMNEGIQIAQRGALVIEDETVRSVPAQYRDLFFPSSGDPNYYSNRFMGFFLLDPDTGAVTGQFPHLYPMWIAVAYGIDGLSGARWVTELWAVLGLVAVYFLGVRIAGHAAAFAAAALLAVHVLQIWYARYPNAELIMQPLVVSGVLAYTRMEDDGDWFFGALAALLLVLSAFAHLTGLLAIAAVGAAGVMAVLAGRRTRLAFWGPLAAGTVLAIAYLASYLPPYFREPVEFMRNLRMVHLLLIAIGAGLGAIIAHNSRGRGRSFWARVAPAVVVIGVWTMSAYALFWRTGGGSLAPYDADGLRTFASFYLTPYGLAAALVGLTLLAIASPEAGAFVVAFLAFAFFFFYKMRIVPEHFWAGRRLMPVILPGSLLLVGAAAFARPLLPVLRVGWIRVARTGGGILLVVLLATTFLRASEPVLHHVEYAGLIPRLEHLAGLFGDDDLVLVESRNASDTHVLALPLSYIYARHVLVLSSPNPDKAIFREFLAWSRTHYRRVFFVGAGGTELLSRTMAVTPVTGERFQVPEYDSPRNAYPKTVRLKEFDLSVYEFPAGPRASNAFDLDIGAADDLYVRHFHAKERGADGFTFRWTRDVSYVSIVGTREGDRELVLWMSSGGRPQGAPAAVVDLALNDRELGAVTVGRQLQGYHFSIPTDLASAMAASEEAAQLKVSSATWNPAQFGTADDRDLGVMVDRVQIK
jgi:hypothetical protein